MWFDLCNRHNNRISVEWRQTWICIYIRLYYNLLKENAHRRTVDDKNDGQTRIVCLLCLSTLGCNEIRWNWNIEDWGQCKNVTQDIICEIPEKKYLLGNRNKAGYINFFPRLLHVGRVIVSSTIGWQWLHGNVHVQCALNKNFCELWSISWTFYSFQSRILHVNWNVTVSNNSVCSQIKWECLVELLMSGTVCVCAWRRRKRWSLFSIGTSVINLDPWHKQRSREEKVMRDGGREKEIGRERKEKGDTRKNGTIWFRCRFAQ